MRDRAILMMRISPARMIAFRALEAVANGANASDILRDLSHPLTTRDAGLASQILFGCLRWQKQLDFLIEMYSGRRTAKLDVAVLIALRSGIFQLRYLERIPAHAAVHDAVEWVKKTTRSAAGLVNAVLRKVNRDPVAWPDEATALSIPDWVLARWTEHFGAGQARRIAEAALEEPTPYIRIPAGVQSGDLRVEPTEVPGAYKVLGPIPPAVRLHDVSSQAIIPLLDLQPS